MKRVGTSQGRLGREGNPAPQSLNSGWHPSSKALFPLAVVLAAVILSALSISGTSVGVLQPGRSSVIAGTPRPVRSDEWNVATPLVVAQSHHGFPETTQDGIGSHNLNVLLDVPTRSWETIFRPWDYGFFVLGVTKAFALRWWAFSVLLLLGAYWFLLKLVGRTSIAVLFSVGLWLSPFFHWWYQAITLGPVGFGMIAVTAVLTALDARRGSHRILLLLLAIWATVGFALLLYPPFQVPTALVVVIVGVGKVRSDRGSWRETGRVIVRPLAAVLGPTLVVLAGFYLDNRTAIHLINSTVYPGQRREVGGVKAYEQLFSAPFGYRLATRGGTQLRTSNQSEISSVLFLGPYVCAQLLWTWIVQAERRFQGILLAASLGFGLIATWYFVGLPSPAAVVTGLDRVEPVRSIGGMGIAGMLLAALFACSGPPILTRAAGRPVTAGDRRDPPAHLAIWGCVVCAVTAFVVTFLSGRSLGDANPGLLLGSGQLIFASAAVALIVLLITGRRPVIAGVLLCCFGAVISLPANPLYRGLGPLTDPHQTGVFTEVPDASRSGWVAFTGFNVNDVLIASGLRTLNAVSVYPNPAAWHILDPRSASKNVWDRYANIQFVDQPGLAQARITLLQADSVKVEIDPCGTQLSQLGVHFAVFGGPTVASCLVPASHGIVSGAPAYVYRIADSQPAVKGPA